MPTITFYFPFFLPQPITIIFPIQVAANLTFKKQLVLSFALQNWSFCISHLKLPSIIFMKQIIPYLHNQWYETFIYVGFIPNKSWKSQWLKLEEKGLAVAFITAMRSIIGAEYITNYNELLKQLSTTWISMRFQNSWKLSIAWIIGFTYLHCKLIAQ